MKKYILIALLPFLFFYTKGTAQVALGISQYTYTISNDTLPAGASDSTFIWIVNRSATNFSGSLVLHTAVQDSSSFLYHHVDSVNLSAVSIPAGDSIPYTLYPIYTTSPVAYHYDINVIVIWPAASGTIISDSLHYTEVILLHAGINVIDLNQYMKAYPNPATDNFMLECKSKTAIEEVRIYNSQGQLITIIKEPGIIDTEKWTKGIYMLDVRMKTKQRQVLRVIKQ